MGDEASELERDSEAPCGRAVARCGIPGALSTGVVHRGGSAYLRRYTMVFMVTAPFDAEEPERGGSPPHSMPGSEPAELRVACGPLPPATLPIAGMVRRVRRIAAVSQRELAERAAVASSTVSRVESGALLPTVALLERFLRVAGLRLVVVDDQRREVLPMQVWDDTRDGADRRYPPHVDTILDPMEGEWWGDRYGLARPPETFHRDEYRRRVQRRRSQWEVRVAQYRHDPPPPDPLHDRRWRIRGRG